MVLASRFPDIAIPNVSFHQLFLDAIKYKESKIALIDGETGEKLTYQQVFDYSKKLAASFAKLGLNKGDLVACLLPNCLEYILIYIATISCGAIFTPCNPRYTEAEVKGQLNLSRPTFVIVQGREKISLVENVSQTVESIKDIISIDEIEGYQSITKLIKSGNCKDYPEVSIDCSKDICLLPYSSGTTGLPKGVMLTHRNIVSQMQLLKPVEGAPNQISFCVLPFFHIFGMMALSNTVYQGNTLVLQRKFSLHSMYKNIETYRVTSLTAIPAMILEMNNSDISSNYDLSSLVVIFCGAAPLSKKIGNRVGQKVQAAYAHGWSLTEALPCLTQLVESVPEKSYGVVRSNTLLKIINPDSGTELGANEKGEICIKGPQVTIGYYKNPEATKQAIDREGWLHTGDIGYFDENEFIFIVDRMKELIKYKGFQVAPAELEELLLQHPKVSDAGVIGIPDKEAGEVPKAFLVKKDGSLVASEIHEFIKGKLSSYKYLRGGIEFIEKIPRSQTGKILRRELKLINNLESKI